MRYEDKYCCYSVGALSYDYGFSRGSSDIGAGVLLGGLAVGAGVLLGALLLDKPGIKPYENNDSTAEPQQNALPVGSLDARLEWALF